MKIHKLFVAPLLALGLTLTTACALDLVKFERALTSPEGVEGEIHGANRDMGLYVFTYRNPENFFDYVEMSLVPSDSTVVDALAQAQRHDRVRIKGKFMENRSPQKHIQVSSFEVVKKYPAHPEIAQYEYEAQIPEDLQSKSEALFLVHAVHADGKILVVEYKDAVIPIFVRQNHLTRDLARNDLVRLSYKLRSHPERPVHLQLNEGAQNPVQVVQSVMQLHGQQAQIEGALVLFPKSPQVAFNVFAVLEELPEGLKRQYTLVNFESSEVFKEIREKLQAAWDAHPESYSGRNKLISAKVRVRATGRFNEVDRNQANVQIVLDGPKSVEIL